MNNPASSRNIADREVGLGSCQLREALMMLALESLSAVRGLSLQVRLLERSWLRGFEGGSQCHVIAGGKGEGGGTEAVERFRIRTCSKIVSSERFR